MSKPLLEFAYVRRRIQVPSSLRNVPKHLARGSQSKYDLLRAPPWTKAGDKLVIIDSLTKYVPTVVTRDHTEETTAVVMK